MVGGEQSITDIEGKANKLPYPKAIGFIVSNELCERFCFYGMRSKIKMFLLRFIPWQYHTKYSTAILVLYLTRKLGYDDDTATVVYHVYGMLVYFMCLFGAILSDSWLGKFRTILYLSIVYAIGSVVISLGAVPPLYLPGEWVLCSVYCPR